MQDEHDGKSRCRPGEGDDTGCRHCEEQSDEAIQTAAAAAVWIASLRSQ
jgi:hypothetical protein